MNITATDHTHQILVITFRGITRHLICHNAVKSDSHISHTHSSLAFDNLHHIGKFIKMPGDRGAFEHETWLHMYIGTI